ncbi:hypothetical protein FUA48_05805 [Flavobacterium alkalisoli]|uniref:Uncharacterized protein n=1 Tax=Flavobacterium alkalisoli TaxID=2602769 RepID=A0A5B9FSL4_9FLAO|nr:hypothetical protein [Flavobacterium alkalisoli]QEE49111.1 hypothetical protein FUA48_05805 [Flavobacterium alkalisoli]
MTYGFYISLLSITGDSLEPAILSFTSGFNLISGGSDTGKSFAFSCLDYMLGKIEAPDGIPESVGYNNIYLEIKTYSGKTFTLLRNINGGDFVVKESSYKDFFSSKATIKNYSVHSQSNTSISDFFLSLSGIDPDIQIKSTQQNKKKRFTFTTLRNLTFIDETTITIKTSPIYGNQGYLDYTYYKNSLSFLLTGKNANDLINFEDAKNKKSWNNGRLDFVNSQIIHFNDNLQNLISEKLSLKTAKEEPIDTLFDRLEKLNTTLQNYVSERTDILNKVEEKNSLVIYKTELLKRLSLLLEHYLSDQYRLDFILNGDQLLNQLNSVDCPICDSTLGEEKANYLSHNMGNSIKVEKEKISLKIKDLETTIVDNQEELGSLSTELDHLKAKSEKVDRLIKEILTPSLDNLKASIETFNRLEKLNAQIEIYSNELNYYNKEQTGLQDTSENPLSSSTTNDGFGIKELTKIIEKILRKWDYQDNTHIDFNSDHKVYDIVIGGKPRGSYGKGMRSISYTAFILSILKYCLKESRPFSNLLVFDSPLTTYHRGGELINKKDEEISQDIQNSFFKDFSKLGNDCQVIMFDNKTPNIKLIEKINFIYFTKDKNKGRYGLFPT